MALNRRLQNSDHDGQRSLHAFLARWVFLQDFREVFQVVTNFSLTDLIYKSQNAPVPNPTMLYSEQKCAHSEICEIDPFQ